MLPHSCHFKLWHNHFKVWFNSGSRDLSVPLTQAVVILLMSLVEQAETLLQHRELVIADI